MIFLPQELSTPPSVKKRLLEGIYEKAPFSPFPTTKAREFAPGKLQDERSQKVVVVYS
jgi:hypothetical protein